MPFELLFLPSALKEWEKLGDTLRAQFKKKLAERLRNPRVEADKLRAADLKDCYKIKLRSAGYRLVYQVDDTTVTVTVITVGKRERATAYEMAKDRQRKRSIAPGGASGTEVDGPASSRRKR